MEQFYENETFRLLKFFFGLKSYGFEHFQAFPGLWKHKKSIFSKSKPLNENRLDKNFILVPLNTPLALFDVGIHIKRAY